MACNKTAKTKKPTPPESGTKLSEKHNGTFGNKLSDKHIKTNNAVNQRNPKRTGKKSMSDIQGRSAFQGQCEVLRNSFFRENVANPPLVQPNRLPPHNQTRNETFKYITEKEIKTAIPSCDNWSAPGKDEIRYEMIRMVSRVLPSTLRTLFNSLL